MEEKKTILLVEDDDVVRDMIERARAAFCRTLPFFFPHLSLARNINKNAQNVY